MALKLEYIHNQELIVFGYEELIKVFITLHVSATHFEIQTEQDTDVWTTGRTCVTCSEGQPSR